MEKTIERLVNGNIKVTILFLALSLVNLAPDIIEAILNGIRPSPKATAGQEEPAKTTLFKLRKGFPEDWNEQRKLFGMK